jgi:glycosyltransferase involved in cell wall biosynthesis
VLNVIGSLSTGGAEFLLYYLHRHLGSEGHDGFSICTLIADGELHKRAEDEALPVISLGLSSKRDPRAIFRMIRVIRAGRFNMVHSHLTAAGLYSLSALIFLPRVRFIHTIHGMAPKDRIALFTKLIHKFIGMKADRIVAVSEESRRGCSELSSVPGSRICVIHNAIVSEIAEVHVNYIQRCRELGIDNRVPVLLAVGRIYEQKGYNTLLEAARLLKQRGQRYKLLIAGDGPLWDDMNRLRDALDLRAEVSFLGRRDDVPELLHLADVFVLASNWEGLPISIIEAMMCRRAIVATRVGGTPEAIRDRIDGLLVPPNDAPSLASALMEVLSDGNMRSRLGESARKRAYEEFTMDAMIKRLTGLYERVLREGSRNV